jgi:tetratricopeptide (TPR) repeat protein
MSLLLEALQKAARSREQAPNREAPGPDADEPKTVESFGPLEPSAPAAELTLEPAAKGEPLLEEEIYGDDIGADLPRGPTPDQAATVVRAAQSREPSAFSRALENMRDRPLLGVIAAAILFALGGSIYLYIQIANPGLLVRTPPPPDPIVRAPEPLPAPKPVVQSPPPVATPPAAPVVPTEPMNIAAPIATAVAPVTARAAASAPTLTPEKVPQAVKPMVTEKPAASDLAAISKAEKAIKVARKPTPADRKAVKIVHAEDQVSTHTAESPPAVARPTSGAPAGLPPELLEAYQALQEGRYEQAEVLYKKVAAADPRNIDALLGLGAIAWQKGDAEAAATNYQRVLELDPSQPTAQGALISIMGRGDPQASESRLKQLLAREPNAFLYFALGTLHAEQGAWPAAQQAYFQAYQMQPDSPDYAFNLAVGLEHVGQQKTALVYYRKALDLSFKKGRANFDQSLAIERVGLLSARLP